MVGRYLGNFLLTPLISASAVSTPLRDQRVEEIEIKTSDYEIWISYSILIWIFCVPPFTPFGKNTFCEGQQSSLRASLSSGRSAQCHVCLFACFFSLILPPPHPPSPLPSHGFLWGVGGWRRRRRDVVVYLWRVFFLQHISPSRPQATGEDAEPLSEQLNERGDRRAQSVPSATLWH